MIPKLWVQENRKHLVCVDSYTDGVLKGRFFDLFQEVGSFDSLSQFLIRMEEILDGRQEPQSYTEARTFSSFLETAEWGETTSLSRRGNRATFELQILFRQHSSWQGVLIWRETGMEHSFRSVLELVILMDSALRSLDGRDAHV
ncbi:MAG: hypothetical protein J6J12_05635 [Oscillospiraceae bacterium]|nr:hypothetical protein [Oscillospiraceae bacterium]